MPVALYLRLVVCSIPFILLPLTFFHKKKLSRWEQYVYLAGRGPIMVNSNYYGMDLIYYKPTGRQASRAANLIYSMFHFRSVLDKENVKPVCYLFTICMFNSYLARTVIIVKS